MPSPKAKLTAAMLAICCLPLAAFGLRFWLEGGRFPGQVVMKPALLSMSPAPVGLPPTDSLQLVRQADPPQPPEPQTQIEEGGLAFPDEPAAPEPAAPQQARQRPPAEPPAPGSGPPRLRPTQGWRPTPIGGIGGTERKIFYHNGGGPVDAPVLPPPQAPQAAPAAQAPEEPAQAPTRPARRSRSATSAALPAPIIDRRERVAAATPSPLGSEAIHLQPAPALPPASPRPPPPAGHTVTEAPPDTRPNPSPESPRTSEGPCPRSGWWKNSASGLCYFTKPSCEGAANRQGTCSQPNP